MKATEFISEELLDELASESHRTKIQGHLKKNGYKKMGEGAGAMVYSKDAGSVIKIIFPVRISDMDTETEIWKTYYNICQFNTSPHLAKFVNIGGKHYETFVLDGEEFTMIAMEKLRKIPEGTIEEAMVWLISDKVVARTSWAQTIDVILYPETWKYFDGYDTEDLLGYIANNVDLIESEWGPYFEVCEKLFNIGEQKGFFWDLHTENVMLRGNVPVIIDPWTC